MDLVLVKILYSQCYLIVIPHRFFDLSLQQNFPHTPTFSYVIGIMNNLD